ncbi:MAG: hypothetical protein GX058_03915 [Firmicutes bacterium]|nr:hypothetical protein [Bacillota bacterium]
MLIHPKRLVIVLVGLLVVLITGQAMAAEVVKCEQPVAMTAPGQAPDFAFAKILLERAGISLKTDPLMRPDELTNFKTLILIIGGSGKGLGAAGIDIEDEIARAQALLDKARSLNMTVVGMHLGGEARRGDNSARFIDLITPQVDFLVVRSDGNMDGIFTRISSENNIPLVLIEKTAELSDVIAQMF